MGPPADRKTRRVYRFPKKASKLTRGKLENFIKRNRNEISFTRAENE